MELRTEALRELTDTRDELDSLRREIDLAHEPSTSYAARLVDLRARQRVANNMLGRAGELVEQAEGIEADPISWYDSLAQRMPHMLPEVPW